MMFNPALCDLQARCASAYEAFNSTLLQHHGSVATEAEQQQVAAAKAELQQQLSEIAAKAVQQVRTRAATATARKQAAAAGGQFKQQEQAAAGVLQSFVEQLQSAEHGCTDVTAAQQACKVNKANSYADQAMTVPSLCIHHSGSICHKPQVWQTSTLSCWSACGPQFEAQTVCCVLPWVSRQYPLWAPFVF